MVADEMGIMAKWEVKKLHFWRSPLDGNLQWMPAGLNIVEKLWWQFVPGEIINVRWPVGDVEINESMPQWDWTIGPSRYVVVSADPNDHYRPYLEKHVGRQGWDWNWGMANNDVAANRLTIKIRRKYRDHATILALKWT